MRKDLGVDAARRVAQVLVAAPHREGNQAQFISRPLEVTGTGPIGALCALVKENPWEEFTLEDMAARCSMSARTLTRRFRDATGTTPLQWVLAQRMDSARRLLEATDLSVDEIAQRCGFGAALNLRTHFDADSTPHQRPTDTTFTRASVEQWLPRSPGAAALGVITNLGDLTICSGRTSAVRPAWPTIERAQIGSSRVHKPIFDGFHLVRGEWGKQVFNRDIRG